MDSASMDVLRDRLATVKGRWPDIAELAGMSVRTLRKIAQKKTENPRVITYEKVVRALDAYSLGQRPQ